MDWPSLRGRKFKELTTTIILGAFFVCLGSSRVLLIKFSVNQGGKYSYLPVTVNICSEVIKLVVCGVVALKVLLHDEQKTFLQVMIYSCSDCLELWKWSIPGLLYFVDNLIAFFVIKYFQPAMVVLMGNFGIITTSVMFRLVLKRKLTCVQWSALVILFLSIVSLSNQSRETVPHHRHHAISHLVNLPTNTSYHGICEPSHTYESNNSTATSQPVSQPQGGMTHLFSGLSEGHLLLFIQCLISSAANIYNEKIFKAGDGLKQSIYVQNTKLYMFGVVFNSMIVIIHSLYRQRVSLCGFFHGHNVYSVTLIFVTAAYGLTIALILKFRDNMFYLLSTQVTTVVMVTASIYFFHFEPGPDFFLMSPVVLLAIVIYNKAAKKATPPENGNGPGKLPEVVPLMKIDSRNLED